MQRTSNNTMKHFTFLFSAIEAAAANANVHMDTLSDQTIDIIYAVVERRGSARCCGQIIRESQPGLYTLTPEQA